MTTWWICHIKTNTKGGDILSTLLYEIGCEGITIEDPQDFLDLTDDGFGIVKPDITELYQNIQEVNITAYFPAESDKENSYAALLDDKLKPLSSSIEREVSWSYYEETTTWEEAYHASFSPLPITSHITIVPLWLKDTYTPVSSEEHIIYIEPGLAFGTGDHPTTKLALLTLEEAVHLLQTSSPQRENLTLYDVGTGTGLLAIAAKALGVKEVIAMDLDAAATQIARETISHNTYAHDITVIENDLLVGITRPSHIIVANIVAEILDRLIEDAYRLTLPKGYVVLSGILTEKLPPLLARLQNLGFLIINEREESGWHSLLLQRP